MTRETMIYQGKKGQALLLLFGTFFATLFTGHVDVAMVLGQALALAAPAYILGQAHVDARGASPAPPAQ